ncbi:MAG: putative O-glycosylation ligase, exosortase A system-associated [Proteobacteria bacterium]|nr:MAG: putative O-glycosylation ligase, exosortase A system-associated [Pseudomonadota bacterium]
MRDILLVGFLFVVIYFSFRKPFIGVSAWVWMALTAPGYWAFGFSRHFRLNLTIVLVTAVAYLFYKNKPKFQFTALHFWVFAFGFWTLISTIFNIQIDSGYVWEKYIEFLKILVLFFFVALSVEKKVHIDTFVWAIVLSISAYAGMEAVKFILSGGGHRIVGRAGIIADRNDLAVAVNMCIPLILYLRTTVSHKYLKLGLLILALLNVVAIVGTYSRGGFVGLAILSFAVWLKSNRKLIYALLAAALLPVLYENAPQDWRERQSTVETAATEDSSFIGRLWAWKIATLIAVDYPFTGGGFKATTDPVLWNTYAPFTPEYGPVQTPPIPIGESPKAAHNIYFQVLGGSGFVGLFLFLAMMLTGFFRCQKYARIAKKGNNPWQTELLNAIALSFIAYGITGINVSLAYFELVYAFLALVAVIPHAVNKERIGYPATSYR